MGIDVDAKYDGTGSTFFTTMLVIEELSKVDPSVGAMVEVHNSLVVETFNKYASEEQKLKWLPRLSNDMVRSNSHVCLLIDVKGMFSPEVLY
jgi:alkylation response protein AidB-like acyl-CoA dehydrogenase